MSLQVRRLVGGPLKHNELLRIAHRERTKQGSINQAEDSSVGADAEGEGEDGDDGEARGLAKLAEGEAAIG